MMRDITVLLTCCNGIISPGQIGCLRDISERKVRVIGVDAGEHGYGSRIVDSFHQVPRADSPEYTDILLDICKAESVDVVLVANDAEFFLSAHKAQFAEIGTHLALNDHDLLVKVDDKATFFAALRELNLPSPRFAVPSSIEELVSACYDLGYPEYPVVVKPRRGGGSRGVRIVHPAVSRRDVVLGKPGNPNIALEDLKLALSEGEEFPSVVVMEYLPGQEYSVDSLVDRGDATIVVPKTRDLSEPGRSVIARVDLNPEVIRTVKNICAAFQLHYNINIQLKVGRDGVLYPYELNPRIAATIAACRGAGANVLYYGVKLALGEDIPGVELKDKMRMIRYYQEHYEYPDQ